MSPVFGSDLDARLNNVINLPTLPQVLVKVTSMLQDPKVSANEVAEVISKDQALVARVLKIVNSAFYGFPRQIKTINHALVILGFHRLKAAIMTASVFDLFKDGENGLGFDVMGFWEHSIGVGLASKITAQVLGIPEVEEFFIFGLVHDIGKLVLDFHGKELYAPVVQEAKKGEARIRDIEMDKLGFDHTSVGGWLFNKWNMPVDMVDVVAYHHNILSYNGKHTRKIAVVYVGDVIARMLKIGNGGDVYVPEINHNIFSLLKFDHFAIDAICSMVVENMQSVKDFIDMVKGSE